MLKNKKRKIRELWVESGWTSFALFVIFLAIYISRFIRDLEATGYLYISIGLFIASVIQLGMKYKKK
ncbi:MAG: hypothetical protein WDZ69_02810 [Candidatus Pacearchaeota archaeon]